MVDERVANEIRKVRVCQNCQAASPPETVEFVITEHITNTTRR